MCHQLPEVVLVLISDHHNDSRCSSMTLDTTMLKNGVSDMRFDMHANYYCICKTSVLCCVSGIILPVVSMRVRRL